MKRKNFSLSKKQIENLDTESRKTGISSSEILRRIIDKYFDSEDSYYKNAILSGNSQFRESYILKYALIKKDKLNEKGNRSVKWGKLIKKRDNYICQICKSKENTHSHHLESYASNKELRLDVNNGICLCEKCHRLFHKEFGRTNNTKEQFEIFKSKYSIKQEI